MNLYVNAWQAMPTGGNLYLLTANVCHAEDDVRGFDVQPGNYVHISVTDSGVGMDADILNQDCNGFIQKPFNLQDLSIKVKEILDRK